MLAGSMPKQVKAPVIRQRKEAEESGKPLRNEFKRRRCVCVDFTWNFFIKSVNILIYSWGGGRKEVELLIFTLVNLRLE